MIGLALRYILANDPTVLSIVGGAGAIKVRPEFSPDMVPCVVYSASEKREYYVDGTPKTLREFIVEVESHATAHDAAELLATAVFNALCLIPAFPVTAGGVYVRQITPNDDREDASQSEADGKAAIFVRTESFSVMGFIPVTVATVHDNGDQTATWTFTNGTGFTASTPIKVQGDFSAFKVSDGTTTYTPTAAAIVTGGVKFTYTNGTHSLTAWSVAGNDGINFSAGSLAIAQAGSTS